LRLINQKSFAYTYNEVNNITILQRDNGQGDGYEYDENRQITGFKQNGTVNAAASSMGVTFDGCGNRMSLSNSNTSLPSYTYAVNGLNQYTAMTAPGDTQPQSRSTEGRIISRRIRVGDFFVPPTGSLRSVGVSAVMQRADFFHRD